MKKVDIKDLEIGKLYADSPCIEYVKYTAIMRYLGVRDGERIFKHVSGLKYPLMNGDEVPFSLDTRASFYEVEEAPIEKMQSDMNSFFAIIDSTVAKLKATAIEIEKLKQKP